jgi:GT2 family glycosyltransferase
VVDDASTDNSFAIASEFSEVRIHRLEMNAGPSIARNAGAAVAEGELFIFLDSDCTIADRQWIGKHLQAHARGERRLVGGSVRAIGVGIGGKAFSYNNWFVCHPGRRSIPKGVYHLQTTNLSMRRDHFNALGGFDINLRAGEDVEFSVRAKREGVAIVYLPEICIEHINRTTFGEYIEVNYRYGRSRILMKRLGLFPAAFLLQENRVLNALMLLPLSIMLTGRVTLAWIPTDWKILLYWPLVFVGQVAMTVGAFRFLVDEQRGARADISAKAEIQDRVVNSGFPPSRE